MLAMMHSLSTQNPSSLVLPFPPFHFAQSKQTDIDHTAIPHMKVENELRLQRGRFPRDSETRR